MEGVEEMPIGNPTPQTIASEKYQKKTGWMAKSFKLKKDVVEEFEQACKEAGVSQAGKITELMKQFIEEVKASE